jgi:hypothetical protein
VDKTIVFPVSNALVARDATPLVRPILITTVVVVVVSEARRVPVHCR